MLVARLTFGRDGNARPLLGEGWAHDEQNFVWAIGTESGMLLPRSAGPAKYLLQIRVIPFLYENYIPSQRLAIVVNGQELASHTLTAAAELECEIPEHVAAKSFRLHILFLHPDAARPSDLADTIDDRLLAVAFQECRLLMVDASASVLATTSGAVPVPTSPTASAEHSKSDDLVPPADMLFDGSTTVEAFKRTGEGFTHVNLLARGRLQPSERVLDLGSGNGQKARVLAYYLDHNGSYEGLDIVKLGVEWCQQHYAVFPNFHFQHADVFSSHYNPTGRYIDCDYRLPFPDADFDMVFLSSVFTHMLPDGVANYIAEISRVLKPGGRCVATFFLLNSDSITRINAGKSSLDFASANRPYSVIDQQNPSKSVALQEDWVRGQLAAAGLRVAEATYGSWAGGKDLLAAYQDVLIALKE
jgi:SAM-dependent methyltransferase